VNAPSRPAPPPPAPRPANKTDARHNGPVRILVAPDKFKGTLSARAAADAIAEGARRAAAAAATEIEIDLCPLSDGGEGFVDVLKTNAGGAAGGAAVGVSTRRTRAHGPFNEIVDAEWLLATSQPATAYLEMASVAGLALVPEARRDPMRATTAGLADLIRAAAQARARRIVIGLGGSATVDGGVGMAGALGARFFDERGGLLPASASALERIARIELPKTYAHFSGIEFIGACDVDNPLCGGNGAARVYAPQKGATPAQVERLEAGLLNLARCCRMAGLPGQGDVPGAGAAGGMGFGLMAFLGARLERGIGLVMFARGFSTRLAAADLVITGEGRLDEQSLRGKVVAGVARAAAGRDVPCLALAGEIAGEKEALLKAFDREGAPIADAAALTDLASSREDAVKRARELVAAAAAELVGRYLRDAEAEPGSLRFRIA